ncbi:MAG: peptide deformylase [Pedosphaera sp.]|nr:peptide deformylase [Pedosphaera sp.]MST01307.1 peptide deformylase [Pedosphaera sp.]
MSLEVVKYGHPALRQKGARIEKITPEIKKFIGEMLLTMEDYHGVGLAAQQVGQALQLAVIDVRATDRPSTLWLDGKPADPATLMPLVLINPEVKPAAEPVAGGEGCLSFPEIFSEITRPEQVHVTCTNTKGERISFRCGGLFARAVQHEVDHLNGILFIDRMESKDKRELQLELEVLQTETKAALKRKK